MKAIRFHINDSAQWDNFIDHSRNGTFLFHRSFMDYHADRFMDFSLMIYDQKNNLKAVFPANHKDNTIFTHEGLTYGGLIVADNLKYDDVKACFNTLLAYYNERDIQEIVYKVIPSFYHNRTFHDDTYILGQLGAKNFRTDMGWVIDKRFEHPLQSRRRRTIRKAAQLDPQIVNDESSFHLFWNEILIPNLRERFNVNPVHSLEEILRLKSSNVKNIEQYIVKIDDKIVAGATIFINKNVVHTQYLSANAEGKKFGALDYLMNYLIHDKYNACSFFSFGIVNEEEGKILNKGLLDWKESFGAVSYPNYFFKLKTNSARFLDKVYK